MGFGNEADVQRMRAQTIEPVHGNAEQAARVAKQHSLKARFDILLSIPGLGTISALAMLIDISKLGGMQAKQAASRTGWPPSPGSPEAGRTKASSRADRRTCAPGALYARAGRHPLQSTV
jgi:transposase